MRVILADLAHSYQPSQASGSYGGNEAGFVVPLGIASIASYAKKVLGDELEISVYKFAEEFIEACEASEPDVIGFSNYVWNAHLNQVAGEFLREKYPNVLMVAGGPSVQADKDGIGSYLSQNRYLDCCVVHEGEQPFVDILLELKSAGKSFIHDSRTINGVGFVSPKGELIYSPNPNSKDINEYPSPYASGLLDEFLSKGLIPMFETNRGCPFGCTYCAWGIAALQKVRKYSMDRVLEDMEYASVAAPEAPTWFIADANFGILKRDIEIAAKIKSVKEKNTKLKTIVMYESKNTPDRNYEIAQLLRNQNSQSKHRMNNALIALQSLDESAQIATNRKNIKLEDIAEKVESYHNDGYGVRTDILSGLPGETAEGHLESLRQVFNFGFDQIGIYNVVLLAGTDMAAQESRDKYKLETKFYTRDGYFGEYKGLKSVEAEEVICGNSTVSTEELLKLRLLHWTIWFGWNQKHLKPLLEYAQIIHNLNPVDVLYTLVNGTRMKSFYQELRGKLSSEFFDSAEALRAHYLEENTWDSLTVTAHKPAHLLHNAMLIMDKKLLTEMLEALKEIIVGNEGSSEFDQLSSTMKRMRIDPTEMYYQRSSAQESIEIPSHLARFLNIESLNKSDGLATLILEKTYAEQDLIREQLSDCNFEQSPLTAICTVMGNSHSAFNYELSIG